MPVGALAIAWCTLMCVVPFRRPRRLALLSWISSASYNELPFLFLYIVVANALATIADGDADAPSWWVSLTIAAATTVGLLIVATRSLRTAPVVRRALADGLGPDWGGDIAPALSATFRRRLPWWRILFVPWMFGRRDVEHTRNISYGNGGTSNLLDVYRHRSRPIGAPTLVYLHGGGFTSGRKNREARPLLYHLASQGWTCVSANYHLGRTRADVFPRALVDVKQLIAWIRARGHVYGADPDTIVLVGASAGAHLAATAALTSNDPRFQPGFEAADTSLTAVVAMYGYYGSLPADDGLPSTPLAHHGDPPPCFVVHGDQDTYTPPEGARALVDHLRAVSANPVVYAELPGAQHSFDMFHSVRFETVVDAIERFAASVRSNRVPMSLR